MVSSFSPPHTDAQNKESRKNARLNNNFQGCSEERKNEESVDFTPAFKKYKQTDKKIFENVHIAFYQNYLIINSSINSAKI